MRQDSINQEPIIQVPANQDPMIQAQTNQEPTIETQTNQASMIHMPIYQKSAMQAADGQQADSLPVDDHPTGRQPTDSRSLDLKYDALKQSLIDIGSVAIAFSGGVDSTFLLKTAHDVLGKQAIAITARSYSFPERELKEAVAFCEKEDIQQIIFDAEEFNIEGFSDNTENRCYLCKNDLFKKIWAIARQHHIQYVAEGSNVDDDGDYRPGRIAITEQKVISPLRNALLTKSDIRLLSNQLGLSTWNKPSFACLASRFPYGVRITPERLMMIGRAEQFLLNLGFRQVRVRYHGNLARIETDEDGFFRMMEKSCRISIYRAFQEIGFSYTSIDLLGYRSGSMNETLVRTDELPNR